jgi:hypothetical protein
MRSAKTVPVTLNPVRDYQRDLEFLYARRSAIDAVIASLEEYDRHRAQKPVMDRQRKSA